MSGDVTDERFSEMFVPGGQVEYEERAVPALADFELVTGSERMRTTTDTYTGKRFRWNTTVLYLGKVVPARTTSRDSTHLHPNRVMPSLLAKLNEEVV